MDLTKEVEGKLRALAPKRPKDAYFDPQSYMGTKREMLALTSGVQRNLLKQGYSFSQLPLAEQLLIWDKIYQEGELFEVPVQALYFAEKYLKKFEPALAWKILKTWVKQVDNWGYSDLLSTMFARLMPEHFDPIFTQLKKWNTSKNPWERRQSMVTMAQHFRRDKQISFKDASSMIKNLLDDEDYFVQKGVGWVLREIRKPYPDETKKFLEQHIRKISAAAFTAATEKLDPGFKDKLKALRKRR